MNKKILPLAAAFVLGVIAIFMINTQLEKREEVIKRLERQGKLTKVVVATRDIPQHTPIKSNMIDVAEVPTKDLQPGVLQSVDSAIGKIARVDILKNQFVYGSNLRLPQQAETLAQKTPAGKRAYTLSIDQISAVGGLARPGDRVDVIGIMNIPTVMGGQQVVQRVVLTLFENAKILDIQVGAKGVSSITMALATEEIKILTYALEMGKIKFVLRSPLDTVEKGSLQPFTFETFMQKIYQAMGVGATNTESSQQQEEPKEQIEIYRKGE